MNKNSEAGKMSLILGALVYPATSQTLNAFNVLAGLGWSTHWWEGLPFLGIAITTLLLSILVVILGIKGLLDKEHSKSFALIGCILGLISILLIAVFLITRILANMN